MSVPRAASNIYADTFFLSQVEIHRNLLGKGDVDGRECPPAGPYHAKRIGLGIFLVRRRGSVFNSDTTGAE